MSEQGFYQADELRKAASGRWALIHGALAPHLEPALRKMGKHVACPIHGGKDGFRLLHRDYAERGAAVCNTCGVKKDGISVLMWANDWSYPQAIEAVGDLLRLERKLLPGQEAAKRRREWKEKKEAMATHKSTLPSARQESGAVGERYTYPVSAKAETAYQGVKEAAVVENNSTVPATNALETRSETWLVDLQERINNKRAASNAFVESSIKQVWDKSVPLTSQAASPFWKYLASRSIVLRDLSVLLKGDNVRFHPALEYRETENVVEEVDGKQVTSEKSVVKGKYPALICAIRDVKGDIVTLHRTYLSKNGNKARVSSPRKMMPVPDGRAVVGGAIRLGSAINGVLGVAEGLETALSGFRASGVPTWSLVNTTILEGFEPPADVHTVIIWADKDKSLAGETAANALKIRLEELGLRVFVLVPRQVIPPRKKGIDWNDVLRNEGILGFPNPIMLRSVVFQREVNHA